jgi:hypothetical protein
VHYAILYFLKYGEKLHMGVPYVRENGLGSEGAGVFSPIRQQAKRMPD